MFESLMGIIHFGELYGYNSNDSREGGGLPLSNGPSVRVGGEASV